MENFDRENIDKLLEICQIRQYFPPSNFCAIRYSYPSYGTHPDEGRKFEDENFTGNKKLLQNLQHLCPMKITAYTFMISHDGEILY